MPTENRSSKTETVSVPRERAELLINLLAEVARTAHWLADNSEDCGDEGIDCQRVDFESLSDALDKCEELPELPDSPYVRDGWLRAADELRALLAQPADQHQGEPVAYMACGELFKTLMGARNYAGSMPVYFLYTHPAPAVQQEPVALPQHNRVTVDKTITSDVHGFLDGWNACVAQLAKLGPLYTHADPGEVERLRSCLDEWKKVAGRRLEDWKQAVEANERQHARLAERDALLRDLVQANLEYFPEEECPPQHPGLMARYAALSARAEPSAREVQALQEERRLGIERLPVEPSAPVERDERAEFERAYQRAVDHGWSNVKHLARQLWDARAALERKP